MLAVCAACRTHEVTLALPATPAASAEAAPIHGFDSNAHGAWARAIPRGERFATYAVLNDGAVKLTWRIGPPTPRAPCDYSALASQTFELVVSSERASVTIPLGNRYGVPSPRDLTYCRSRGDRPPSDFAAPTPDVASMFTLTTGERKTLFLAIRDGEVIHVAVQNAPTMVVCSTTKYGPLRACKGHEWSRIADVHVGRAKISELVEDRGRPVDCAASPCAFP